MAHPRPSPVHHQQRTLKLRLFMGAVYLLALSSLILWEYRDHFEFLSNPCDDARTGASETRAALYSAPYKRMLDWAAPDSAGHVSVVTIPGGLEEIQSNLCESRAYIADILQTIAAQHPAEIVLDKFYSPAACASDPKVTANLVSTIRSLPIPVVIGESTDPAPAERDDACLIRKPQLDFAAANVHHGLTRLATESEHIPLQWRVLPSSSEAPDTHAGPADSLGWAAVKAYDPTYAARPRLQSLIANDQYPYAQLRVDLPLQSTTNLLCTAGTPDVQKRWNVRCDQPGQHLNLLGKIVVIGAEDGRDERIVLGQHLWGVELQARYIEALLSGSYLRALPFSGEFILFAAFVFFIEGLPTLLEAFRPTWKKKKFLSSAFQRRRYTWVIFWALSFIVLGTVFSLALGYLPPLLVFGDILFVAITRLLFFAAETFETPLIEPHKRGHHEL